MGNEPSAEEVARVAAEIVGWDSHGKTVLRLDALDAALARARQEGAEACARLTETRLSYYIEADGTRSDGAHNAALRSLAAAFRAAAALPTPPPAAPASTDYERAVAGGWTLEGDGRWTHPAHPGLRYSTVQAAMSSGANTMPAAPAQPAEGVEWWRIAQEAVLAYLNAGGEESGYDEAGKVLAARFATIPLPTPHPDKGLANAAKISQECEREAERALVEAADGLNLLYLTPRHAGSAGESDIAPKDTDSALRFNRALQAWRQARAGRPA